MNKNIKIAKELVRLAKSLVADETNTTEKLTDYDIIVKVAEQVRDKMVKKYGSGDNLSGHCVEASDLIVDELKNYGLKPKSPQGYILLSWDLGWEYPYQQHTWVECSGYFIDVTAEQFNEYLNELDEKFPPICIFKKRPSNLVIQRPSKTYLEEYQNHFN